MARRVVRYIAATSEYSAARHAERLQYWREYNKYRRDNGNAPRVRGFRLGKQASASTRRKSQFKDALDARKRAIHGRARVTQKHSTFQNMRQSLAEQRRHLSLRSAASIHLSDRKLRQRAAQRKQQRRGIG